MKYVIVGYFVLCAVIDVRRIIIGEAEKANAESASAKVWRIARFISLGLMLWFAWWLWSSI